MFFVCTSCGALQTPWILPPIKYIKWNRERMKPWHPKHWNSKGALVYWEYTVFVRAYNIKEATFYRQHKMNGVRNSIWRCLWFHWQSGKCEKFSIVCDTKRTLCVDQSSIFTLTSAHIVMIVIFLLYLFYIYTHVYHRIRCAWWRPVFVVPDFLMKFIYKTEVMEHVCSLFPPLLLKPTKIPNEQQKKRTIQTRMKYTDVECFNTNSCNT